MCRSRIPRCTTSMASTITMHAPSGGVSRSEGAHQRRVAAAIWSVRNYMKHRPPMEHLPEEAQRTLGLSRHVPQSGDHALSRSHRLLSGICRWTSARRCSAWPITRRTMTPRGAVRRAIWRTGSTAITGAEDTQLINWSWESMQSSGFSGMILSDLEAGVRDYHDMLRQMMPVIALDRQPAEGSGRDDQRSRCAGDAQSLAPLKR